MTEDQREPGIPLIQEAEIARLWKDRQAYIDSLTPPMSGAEREKLDEFDFSILEAMARAAQLRAQNKADEQ